MRIIAAVLLIAGTIAATLGGARMPDAEWPLAIPGVVALIAGAVLWRIAQWQDKAAVRQDHAGDGQAVRRDLQSIRNVVGELESQGDTVPLPTLVDRLTELEQVQFTRLSETLPRMAGRLASSAFAELLSAYSSAERHLRRAWSAATDGHAPEAAASLAAARAELDRLLVLLEQALAGGPDDPASPHPQHVAE